MKAVSMCWASSGMEQVTVNGEQSLVPFRALFPANLSLTTMDDFPVRILKLQGRIVG